MQKNNFLIEKILKIPKFPALAQNSTTTCCTQEKRILNYPHREFWVASLALAFSDLLFPLQLSTSPNDNMFFYYSKYAAIFLKVFEKFCRKVRRGYYFIPRNFVDLLLEFCLLGRIYKSSSSFNNHIVV